VLKLVADLKLITSTVLQGCTTCCSYWTHFNVCITVSEFCFRMLVWSTNAIYEVHECKLLTVTGIVL